ncbi:hypothetical protein JB92DRAFT_3068190 [Gautieria morchelliformis]|nr:hypothetical protein JB92DRAFT_3068190 [Gautieria morchelliformis]
MRLIKAHPYPVYLAASSGTLLHLLLLFDQSIQSVRIAAHVLPSCSTQIRTRLPLLFLQGCAFCATRYCYAVMLVLGPSNR